MSDTRLPPLAADHVARPRNAGPLAGADGFGDASNPACGDLLTVMVRRQGETVAEARFMAEGCAATLAAGSCLAEWLPGRSPAEVRALDPAALDRALGGLPEGRYHAVELACRAARRAVDKAFPEGEDG